MNIATISWMDKWRDTHLLRWRWCVYRSHPHAQVFLLIPYKGQSKKELQELATPLRPHFTDIAVVKELEVDGFSVGTDALRADLVDTFQLSKRGVLYVDSDVDILENADELETAHPTADVLWTPNDTTHHAVGAALKAYGIKPAAPYIDPSVMFLRKSLLDEYMAIIRNVRFDTSAYLPGVNAWNVMLRKRGKHAMIARRYCRMAQTLYRTLLDTTAIHYCGNAQGRRMQFDISEWPESLRILREGTWAPPVRWEDSVERWRELAVPVPSASLAPEQKAARAETLRYGEIWQHEEYREFASGLYAARLFHWVDMLQSYGCFSVMDAGCGTGKLSLYLMEQFRGGKFAACDLADNCLNEDVAARSDLEFTTANLFGDDPFKGRQYDAVFCTDVLEHLSEEYIQAALRNLRKATKTLAFFAIAMANDNAGPAIVGEQLHQTVRPREWWMEQLTEAGFDRFLPHPQGPRKPWFFAVAYCGDNTEVKTCPAKDCVIE